MEKSKQNQEEGKIKVLQKNKRRRRKKLMKLLGRTRWRNDAVYEKKHSKEIKRRGEVCEE